MLKKSRLLILVSLLLAAVTAALILRPRPAAAVQPRPTPASAGIQPLAGSAPLPAGNLRLLYAETRPEEQRSTLYLIDPAAPAARQPVAEVTHRQGYPPEGQLAPDGRLAAVLVISPGANETAARTYGGEVWILSPDGGQSQRLTGSAGFLAGWSTDGQWLAYGRLEALAKPTSDQVPLRTELYRIRPNGTENLLMYASQQHYGVNPLGWLPDGTYLVALLDLDGVWTLSAVDPRTRQPVRGWSLPPTDLVRQITLSPTGERVLLEAVRGGQDTLSVIDLNPPAGLQAPALAAAAPFPANRPVGPVQGVWSARGNLWIYQQPQPGRSGQSTTTGAGAPPAQPRLSLASDEYLLVESWSPDEEWFFYRRYPHNYDSAYLQQRGSGSLVPLQPDQPGDWLTFFGWVPAAGGTQ